MELTPEIDEATVEEVGTTVKSAGSSKDKHQVVAWRLRKCAKSKNKAGRKKPKETSSHPPMM